MVTIWRKKIIKMYIIKKINNYHQNIVKVGDLGYVFNSINDVELCVNQDELKQIVDFVKIEEINKDKGFKANNKYYKYFVYDEDFLISPCVAVPPEFWGHNRKFEGTVAPSLNIFDNSVIKQRLNVLKTLIERN